MIYTDVGCCCSLFDVVSSVVFSFCQQVSKQIVCFFLFFFVFFLYFFPFFFFFFCFFLPLSLYPPFSFFLSLSSPSLLTFPTTFFFFFFFFFFFLFIYFFFFPFFFLLSLSCFLCPLVLSVTVWLSKRVYKIKLIN